MQCRTFLSIHLDAMLKQRTFLGVPLNSSLITSIPSLYDFRPDLPLKLDDKEQNNVMKYWVELEMRNNGRLGGGGGGCYKIWHTCSPFGNQREHWIAHSEKRNVRKVVSEPNIGGGTYRLAETWASAKLWIWCLFARRLRLIASDEYYISTKIRTSNMFIYMLRRRKLRNSDNSKFTNYGLMVHSDTFYLIDIKWYVCYTNRIIMGSKLAIVERPSFLLWCCR
jgi:hypothetical protein